MTRDGMIERVARALADNASGWSSDWPSFIPAVRAAIAAMREPTEAMEFAARDMACPSWERAQFKSEWEAAIDAILTEK